jgi:hypothetical protein
MMWACLHDDLEIMCMMMVVLAHCRTSLPNPSATKLVCAVIANINTGSARAGCPHRQQAKNRYDDNDTAGRSHMLFIQTTV